MDIAYLLELAKAHKWIAVSAVLIGLVIRLLKSDTKIPIDIPPKARIWLAIGLGAASGVLEKVASGKHWAEAIFDGLFATMLAVVGHETIIASLRSGKELPFPGLIKPGVPPSPGAPVTEVPPPLDNKQS